MTVKTHEDADLKYRVLLTIKHPSVTPKMISEELEIVPSRTWVAGERRTNPKGDFLDGINAYTLWNSLEEVSGSRAFFNTVSRLIDELEPHSVFIGKVISSGGSVSIVCQLSGGLNIGDQVGPLVLQKMSEMKIDLGIEVFPDY